MKKILKFLLSRTFLFGLLIACQVGLFAALMLVFSRAGTVAYIILTLVSVLVVIAVIERDNINPAYKIMWCSLWWPCRYRAVFYLWWATRASPPKRAQICRHRTGRVRRHGAGRCGNRGPVRREPLFAAAWNICPATPRPSLLQHAERVLSHGQDFFARFWRSSAARRNISSWNILSLKKAKCGTKRCRA